MNEITRHKSPKLPSPEYKNIDITQDINSNNWMSMYGDHKINEVWIPGSHNSAMYSIPDSIINAWSICQTLTIYQQLMIGIRYLDFRVITIDNKVLIAHRFKGGQFKQYLQEIQTFLDEYPTEVIIIRVDHNRTGGKCDGQLVNEVLKEYLDEYLVKTDDTDLRISNINQSWYKRQNCIIAESNKFRV